MFNLFKKKPKPALPPFETLAAYPDKDKYFVRVAQWYEFRFNQSNIVVIDPHGPRMITMDPWPKTVFLNATGNRTVKEYIEYLAGQYDGEVPAALDDTVLFELNKLVYDLKLIALTTEPQSPKPEHDKPLDMSKAKKK